MCIYFDIGKMLIIFRQKKKKKKNISMRKIEREKKKVSKNCIHPQHFSPNPFAHGHCKDKRGEVKGVFFYFLFYFYPEKKYVWAVR
jgi:hypothetical protein